MTFIWTGKTYAFKPTPKKESGAWKGFSPQKTTVRDVHRRLSAEAAQRANDAGLMTSLCPGARNVWKEASNQSKAFPGQGLCIEYDVAWLDARGDEPGWKEAMAEIGRSAMNNTLADNSKIIAGLIVGGARTGRNYFDAFS